MQTSDDNALTRRALIQRTGMAVASLLLPHTAGALGNGDHMIQ